MAFRLSGDVLIACNCDWGCPCNVNARPTKGFCQGGWIWMIDGGHADDVPLDGLGAAVFAKWPGAIHEGGGRATCYIDARASDAQHAALTRVLRGELGGPWGLFIKTYNLAPPVPAPFEVDLAQYGSRASIGDVVELEFQTIRNPVTQAEVHPGARPPRRARRQARHPRGVERVPRPRRARLRSLGPVRRVRALRVPRSATPWSRRRACRSICRFRGYTCSCI